jgi:TetR/AcrR family transcriptional repressor of mexJK operon
MPSAKSRLAPIEEPLMVRRARALREAASRVFLAKGYDAATMEQVAEEAGVTKKTLYNHFRGKDELFEASVAALCDTLLQELPQGPSPSGDLEKNLEHFCETFLRTLAVPPGLEFYRLAFSVSPRFPKLGRAVYKAGPQRINQTLAAYLDQQISAGRLQISDTQQAAQQLIGMMTSRAQLALLGEPMRPNSTDTQAYVRSAVRAFCRAYAPVSSGSSARRLR